jgi:membrane-associated phospholipid phosphatase
MLISFGVVTMALGMLLLWIYGGGLPMNAFPPPRFVEKSVYQVVPHPIYGGFLVACAGVAIFSGSASGLWLVTPAVALCCAALVLGYELPDLQRRFGVETFSPWLPRDRAETPSLLERLRIYPVILLPWLAMFEMFGALGKATDWMSSYLPFETRWPVIEQTELLYASTYVVVLLVPLLAHSGSALRRFAQRGLIAMALIFPLYLLLPFFVSPRVFDPVTALGHLLLWEHTPYSGTAACPSFHVAWAFIAASALGEGRRWKKYLWWTWAVLVAVSCVTTGMHSIADVLLGVVAYVAVVRNTSQIRGGSGGSDRFGSSTTAGLQRRGSCSAWPWSTRCWGRDGRRLPPASFFSPSPERHYGRSGWKGLRRCCVRWAITGQ